MKKTILTICTVVSISSPCFGYSPSEIAKALQEIRPKAEYVLYGTEYKGLVWKDKRQSKPTENEFNSALNRIPDILSTEITAKSEEEKIQKEMRLIATESLLNKGVILEK